MSDPSSTIPTSPAPGAEADATLYLHPQTLARLGSFEMRAKHIVEGVMSGQHRSPYQGFSVEFAQHRPYVAGDDIRHLDWKVYGRSDKLHLKQYQQETNLDLMILVDSSGSMGFGSRLFSDASGHGEKKGPRGQAEWTKFDHATALAAAFSYMALRQGDRAGLAVYADEILAMTPRSSRQGQWRQIVGALSTHPVDRPTDMGRVIDQILAKLNNRCLLVIISDFFEDPAAIRSALARCRHRRHDVIVCQVVDRREAEFDFKDATPFDGLEGEARIRIDPRAIRKDYLKAFKDHQAALRKIVRSFGFDDMVVNTHDWLGPPLAAFVARRNARIKRSKMG
ncbi:MAG: DUF58 domain-containing protein [Phycisphaeraceae bacterium]|nr:MAG: DUF58 domain-containing protein [Phycisphaeraceae bacterium]